MDSNKAGVDAVAAQLKARFRARLDELIEPLIDELVGSALDQGRQALVEMLAHGQPPRHLTINPLSATPTEKHEGVLCIVPNCGKRGSKTKRNFCDDHAKTLSNKEKESYIKAHRARVAEEHNKRRRDARAANRASKARSSA